jgi:regulator of protease activity HflC (stomatin/prohibitin superfamily)
MEEQAAAERQRRATVTRAEGEKEAQILEADGRLEASKRDGEAQVILAQASQEAITKVSEAIGGNDLPMMYLLGEKYIMSMQNLAKSQNAKTVIYPADLAGTVSQLLKKS